MFAPLQRAMPVFYLALCHFTESASQPAPTKASPAFFGLCPEHDEFQKHFTNLVDHGSLPDEAAQLHEQAAQVRACLQALPAKQQQVIYLRFYADDSLEGIAAALGCPVGTVKSRLFHALDRLRGMNALNTRYADSGKKGGPV